MRNNNNNNGKLKPVGQIGDHITVYGDRMGNAISIQMEVDREEFTEIKTWTGTAGDRKIAYWGQENNLPQYREYILKDNNIVPELLSTKRGIILGQGLKAYTVSYEDGKEKKTYIAIPPEVQAWLDQTDWDTQALIAAGELLKHGNIFIEAIRERGTDKFSIIKTHYCKNIRAAEQNSAGDVDTYFWHGQWDPTDTSTPPEVRNTAPKMIPAYAPGIAQKKFMLHVGDPLFYDGYYYYPAYWGGKEWIELSNVIPKFHKANIKNGYAIRFHVRIPKEYFLDKVNWTNANTKDEMKKCMNEANANKQLFIDKMNQFLSGEENAGRAVYTDFEIQETMAKEFPGIQILPISPDLKDEALLKLFEKSNDANISAQGIHPSLASIQTQGKMSSGSEIRNSLLGFIAIKTPIARMLILKILNMVKKANGWDPEVQYTFEDIEITKLDENPAGMESTVISDL
ncbi:MAG: hypothetical protein IPN68_17835 [Bacteroidetes bacterium]|nr:hypothetical protein [Bacteroidota bacterium]